MPRVSSEGGSHGQTSAGTNRSPRSEPVPGHDDLRRAGGRGRPRSRSSTGPSRRASTSSTPPTCTRSAAAPRQTGRHRGDHRPLARGARRALARVPGHQVPRQDRRRHERRRASRASTSSARSRPACAACSTDVIDLYQTHFFDPFTPIDETLRALDDLGARGQGPLRGLLELSAVPAGRGGASPRASSALTRYETLQPRYNLLYREIETELLPYARQEQLGVIVYNPIAGGLALGQVPGGRGAARGHALHHPRRGRDVPAALLGRAQLAAVAELAKEVEARGLALALGRGRLGARAAGHHLGDHRREPTRAARRDAGRRRARRSTPSSTRLCDEVWWRLPRRPVDEGYR